MLTVLWVMSVAGIVAMAGALAGRNDVGAARNRVEWTRAYWRAAACARRAQAAADEAIDTTSSALAAAATWRTLRTAIATSPSIDGCNVALEAAGTRMDANAATLEMFERLLAAAGRDDAHAVAEAIIAARDMQPFADVRDLARAHGFGDTAPYDSLVGVEPGHIALAAAPVTVLLAIPGFTRETAEAVVAQRDAGTPVTDLTAVLSVVSEASASELINRFPDAVNATSADPDAWIIHARAGSGRPASIAELAWRVARTTHGVVVMRAGSAP